MSGELPSTGPMLPGGPACEERAGFLFAHECEQPGVAFCAVCHKRVCLGHIRPTEQGEACITCSRAAGSVVRADDPYYYRDSYRDHSYYDASDRRAFSRTGGTSPEPAGPLDVS